MQNQIARQQAERVRAGADAAADVTPPVLTKFNSSTKFDASNPLGPFKVTVKATDDLSGVWYGYAYAYGPTGQFTTIYIRANYPSTNFSGVGGFDQYYWRYMMYGGNGTWKFYYAFLYDLAGNYVEYDEAALAALGNTTFTVTNSLGGDAIAPTVTSGKVLTNSVSLSAYAPGTSSPPFVGVSVNATDAGTSIVSGVADGHAYFCQIADPGTCIRLYGEVTATGQANVTVKFGTQVVPGYDIPGVYELQHIHLWDHAGNATYLDSNKFGGSTDFSTMFPSTTIKLKP